MNELVTLKDLVAIAEGTKTSPDGRPPWLKGRQDEAAGVLYYRFLHQVAQKARPKSTLECGTRFGHSAVQMAAGNPEGKVLTLDIDPGSKNGVQGVSNIVAVTVNSTTPAAMEAVLSHFQSIDLLFLDSEHRYQTVAAEYRAFAPLVREGGILIFDDINLNPEMKRFWSEVEGPKADVSFLHASCGAGFGVAVKAK